MLGDLQLWAEGRHRALWAGLTPTLIRAFPANAAQWLAWEVAMHSLRPQPHQPQGQREEPGPVAQPGAASPALRAE